MISYQCIDPIMFLINAAFHVDPDPSKIPYESIFVLGYKGDEYIN
tara:strand:- start:281 stop:415 length:135 start_codon:yes stop_codon:yes gene_type:complete